MRISLAVGLACLVLGHLTQTAAAKDPKEGLVLDPEDEPCREFNPHLASLETYAAALKTPEFVKLQTWAKSILPLTPEDDDVRKRRDAFDMAVIRYFDLNHAVIFCRAGGERYATLVGAVLTMAWKKDHWECTDSKCLHAYGKDTTIELEEAEYHKWWHADGPSNEPRAGRTFILTRSAGGAEALKVCTTYRLSEAGKLVEYPMPFVTEKQKR